MAIDLFLGLPCQLIHALGGVAFSSVFKKEIDDIHNICFFLH